MAGMVGGEKIWDAARRRDGAFTCANMFWWYNMYSGADIGVTPRLPRRLGSRRKVSMALAQCWRPVSDTTLAPDDTQIMALIDRQMAG